MSAPSRLERPLGQTRSQFAFHSGRVARRGQRCACRPATALEPVSDEPRVDAAARGHGRPAAESLRAWDIEAEASSQAVRGSRRRDEWVWSRKNRSFTAGVWKPATSRNRRTCHRATNGLARLGLGSHRRWRLRRSLRAATSAARSCATSARCRWGAPLWLGRLHRGSFPIWRVHRPPS